MINDSRLVEQVRNACEESGIEALNIDVGHGYLNNVLHDKYNVCADYLLRRYKLDCQLDRVQLCSPNVSTKIKFFSKENPILFFFRDNEKGFFQFESGNDLDVVVHSCPSFSFFVSSSDFSYLLHFDHEVEVLSCFGDSKQWAIDLKLSAEWQKELDDLRGKNSPDVREKLEKSRLEERARIDGILQRRNLKK